MTCQVVVQSLNGSSVHARGSEASFILERLAQGSSFPQPTVGSSATLLRKIASHVSHQSPLLCLAYDIIRVRYTMQDFTCWV